MVYKPQAKKTVELKTEIVNDIAVKSYPEQISMSYFHCVCGCKRFMVVISEGVIKSLVCERCHKVEVV